MRDDAAAWFASHSSVSTDWPVGHLLRVKGSTRVSVVFPALNEEATVGSLVCSVRQALMAPDSPLVDELVVLDSGSTDSTAAVAAEAGARVVHRDHVLPDLPAVPGKGEALWRSLAATTGDIVVFVDADLLAFDAAFITGLLGPVLTDPTIQLVKATYDRPLADSRQVHPGGGGRVTELVARPLLNAYWPELAGFVQPLAGEYAARRTLLERLPFATGYGVEIGLLIDALAAVGRLAWPRSTSENVDTVITTTCGWVAWLPKSGRRHCPDFRRYAAPKKRSCRRSPSSFATRPSRFP